jgi:hypothetical protein
MEEYDVVLSSYDAVGGVVEYEVDVTVDTNLGPTEALQTEVSLGQGSLEVANLKDLDDVSMTGAGNKFVLIYDSGTNGFKLVNPDEVLDSAAGIVPSDPSPVGFSTDTINYLDDVLDNKIDLDAGEW